MTPTATPAPPLPLLGMQAGFRRFTVAEYEHLTEIGVLTEDDDLELINGYLVKRMSRNPRHDGVLTDFQDCINGVKPIAWVTRCQCELVLARSVPEPDIAVVRADPGRYKSRHPRAADAGLVIEVSDSTLDGDRADKCPIYAEAGIPIYWIVNLVDRRVEVYSNPVNNAYTLRTDYSETASVPFILDGVLIADIAVGPLLP